MKKFLSILTFILPITLFSQQWNWVNDNGKASTSIMPSRVKTNASGDVYSVYTNSFQPSSILFKRQNTAGALAWSKNLGGSNTFAEDITVDANNNSYLLGQFANNLILPDTTLTNGGLYESFIVAYSSAGVRKWVKTFPGGAVAKNFLSNDNAGNLIYVSTQVNMSNTLIAVYKYNSAGTQLYAKSYSSNSGINDLKIDKLNNIHISGTFESGGLTIDGTNYYPGGTNGYQYTSFVAKLNPTGDIKKVKTYPGIYLKGIGMDSTSANYYLAGYFSDSAKIGQIKIYTACNTNTNSPAICEERFMAKTDTNDNTLWAKKSLTDLFVAIDVSKAGNIYLTGKFRDSLVMDGVKLKESIGNRYATFVAKISPAGIAQWAVKDSGSTTTTGTFPQDIAYSSNGSIYLTGTFHNFQNNSYLGQFTLPLTGTVSNYFNAKLMETTVPTALSTNPDETPVIDIYPNPSNGMFNVSGNVTAVYNLLGEKIDYNLFGNAANQTVELKSGSGIYFVEVKHHHQRSVKKIIVQ